MYPFDLDKLKKHPIAFAATIAIGSATLASGALYKAVIEDLRDKKSDLISELQLAKQRVSSLEATLAAYDGQCAMKLQAQNKETQERCDRQLSSTADSSKQLTATNEKLLAEVQRKDNALMITATQLSSRQTALEQLQKLSMNEKAVTSRIRSLHAKHMKVSQEYGIHKVECEEKGEGFFAGNLCAHASMNKAELESIEREIASENLQLSQLQQQILQLQASAK